MNLKLPTDVVFILHTLITNGFEGYIVGGAVRDVLLSKENPTDWDFTTNATPDQIQQLFHESFYENEFGTVGVSRQHIAEQFGLPLPQDSRQKNELSYHALIETDKATKIHESLQNGLKLETDTKHLPAVLRTTLQAGQEPSTKNLFEITTFRSDGSYTDFRRPDQVKWGQTLEEDLHRRDFTINAMGIYVEIQKIKLDKSVFEIELKPAEYQLIDPFEGKKHLHDKLIRTVGIAEQRFTEDALRMLRAVRFAVQLHFELDDHIIQAIQKQKNLIKHVSWERIRDEFIKMLASDTPALAIQYLDESGLLSLILPEIIEAKGVEQGGHHTTDVWTHSIDALQECPSRDPIVRFATLLHDVAKPMTFRRTKKTITFYNHEVIGARIAKNIANRFKLSRHDVQRIFLLVRHHMFYYQPNMTDAALRRFMRKVGLENINDILDVRIGDRLGSGSKETSWRLEEMKDRMLSQMHQPFSIKDLKITGSDVMEKFSLKPGPVIGQVLQHVFEVVLENPELNEQEKLIELAGEFLKMKSPKQKK